jgi:hypothetical protein
MTTQIELTSICGSSLARRACFGPVAVRNVTLTCSNSSVKTGLFVVPLNSASHSRFPSITDHTSDREKI